MPWLRDLNDLSFIQNCKQSPFQPEEWIPGSMPRRRRESGETDTPPKRFRYNLRWGLWYINGYRFTLAPFCTWMLFNTLVITIAHLSYLEKGGEITINCDMRKIIIFYRRKQRARRNVYIRKPDNLGACYIYKLIEFS